MILRAKVKNDFIALRFLRDLVVTDPVVEHLVTWCEAIMPAPSSLWGRVRGRFDIAGYIAAELGSFYGKRVANPPLKLSFRWQKRAMMGTVAKNKLGEILRDAQDAPSVEILRDAQDAPSVEILRDAQDAPSVEILRDAQDAISPLAERIPLPERSEGSRRLGKERLLLIDDVATTGFTVAQLTNELEDFEIKILTIAAAKPLLS